MAKKDSLFRIYWNRDADHSFDVGDDHLVSELLFATGLDIKVFREDTAFSAGTIEGIAYSVTKAAEICKDFNLSMKIDIDLEDRPGFTCPPDLEGWMQTRVSRHLREVHFDNYVFHKLSQKTSKNISTKNNINITMICDPDTPLVRTLWCRPLAFTWGDFGGAEYTQKGTFGGIINNYKWIRIDEYLGDFWFKKGTTVGDYLKKSHTPIEICEGDIPASHTMKKSDISDEI